MFRGIKKIAADIAAFRWWYIMFAVFAGIVARLLTKDLVTVIAVAAAVPLVIAVLVTVRYGTYDTSGREEDIISPWKERVATIVLGVTFNQTFDWVFNYPLYLSVIETNGLQRGYIIMTLLSFLTCLLFIKFYDWLKKDWLGIEVAKEVRDFGPAYIKKIHMTSVVGRILWWPFSIIILILLWAVRQGGIVAFLALSIWTDPFITTVYMRKGRYAYNGMTGRDWGVFIASTVVSNAYWSGRSVIILEVAKGIWRGWLG